MKAVTPARIEFDEHGTPFAPDFGDLYHPREGALAQARHVFIGGNGLPARWRGRQRFALLETGFGLGNNFLATWDAWRTDPRRCARLHFVSIERHPPGADDLRRAHAESPLRPLARQLLAQWPPPTPNLHRVAFDGGAVELLLLFADVGEAIGDVVGRFDAFALDGFAPARNPAMWDARVLGALGRLAAPGATAATWSVAREVRDGLAAAGFDVQRASGFGAKREMTVATFAPRFAPRIALPGAARPAAANDALVVGAGVAGAATAAALADDGFDVRVVAGAARPASAQPGALFHGIVHGADGVHARFTRAAALAADQALEATLQDGAMGRQAGFLRIESARPDLDRMRTLLAGQGLPSRYVQALDARAATALAGVEIGAPAWFYPRGGWVDPRRLCARWLDGIEQVSAQVAALEHDGARWRALDRAGRVIAAATTVVLAGGAAGRDLLGGPLAALASISRGQTTRVAAGSVGLRAPALPMADGGYALTLADGSVLAGAASRRDDRDVAPSVADQRANLQRLERLTGSRIAPPPTLDGDSVGLRLAMPDRLPLVGALPASGAAESSARLDQPRFVPRAGGLYVVGALGSRGVTWAPLAARLLASMLAGAPLPLEADLVNAVDPARFVARRVRRSAS